MTKVRKQKKKKTYRHSSNRRRVGAKRSKLPKIKCPQIKEAWCESKSVQRNMEEMGLVFDSNKTFKIPTTKELLRKQKNGEPSTDITMKPTRPLKKHVVENLEAEAKLPREKNLKLPGSQAKWLAYLIDKYGEDYKAMARDQNNFYQETWKQLRAKINILKSIPGQLEEHLQK